MKWAELSVRWGSVCDLFVQEVEESGHRYLHSRLSTRGSVDSNSRLTKVYYLCAACLFNCARGEYWLVYSLEARTEDVRRLVFV